MVMGFHKKTLYFLSHHILFLIIILLVISCFPASAYAGNSFFIPPQVHAAFNSGILTFDGRADLKYSTSHSNNLSNLIDSPPPIQPPQVSINDSNNLPEEINPLTGLQVMDPALFERRPIAIKITNYPRYVRPQSGLSRADIVYEYYLERGITRFIAIYYGNDASKVGPVRSGRFFDEHIFRMYQSYFVFGSADDRVMDYFLNLGKPIVNRFVLEQPPDKKQSCQPNKSVPLCRDRKIASYNNLFADTQALTSYLTNNRANNYRQDLPGMVFEDQPPIGGIPGTQIDINYSRYIYDRWLFDSTSDRYLRFEETQNDKTSGERIFAPLFDRLTGDVIGADNVVLLYVPHKYYAHSPTDEVIQIDLIASGQAYLFRQGQVYPGLWVRPKDGSLIYLLGLDGQPLAYKPGVTFFEVVGRTTSLQRDGESWGYTFNIP